MGLGGQHHAPAALPPGKTWYPLYRRLGGPQGRSRRVRKISPPTEFDFQAVQPVAGRYTDWAIPAANVGYNVTLISVSQFLYRVKKNLLSNLALKIKIICPINQEVEAYFANALY